ncbi:hypothetical protein ACJRO7_022964 [Eucalyptus globulus]|uniref:Lipid desaturase domain-containing protein n=1 Tax=Eucalyptus globulus TaxID=34317 RepID=A0ABD3K3R2_EUCGL
MAGVVEYVLADLGSGVYHRGIDNYGDASTPVFGAQIEAFLPWTITRRQAANNLHALARAVAFVVGPIEFICNDPAMLGFVACHSWVHITKSKLPPLMVALQASGHHRAPYENNYCIVSEAWNEFLDGWRVFKALEMVLSFKFGLRPWCWSDPNSNWTEDVEEVLYQVEA